MKVIDSIEELFELGIQLSYLLLLLALLGVGSFYVIHQVLLRRELDLSAKELQNEGTNSKELQQAVADLAWLLGITMVLNSVQPVISALIPLSKFREPKIMNKYRVKSDVEVLDMCDDNDCYEYILGNPREMLIEAIEDLMLDSMVMGSRGLSGLKRLIGGGLAALFCFTIVQHHL